MPPRDEITVEDFDEGTTREVELHDGSMVVLKKLEKDYDPTDRSQAYHVLEEAERKGREEQAEKIAEREREEQACGKKKRGRKPKAPEAVETPEAKANVTDPESQIFKTKRGWVQGYNGQAVADCATQVIVAQDVTQQANVVQQLGPMLTRCEEQAGQRPRELLADAGYWSEDNAALTVRGPRSGSRPASTWRTPGWRPASARP